jgi:Icc-related predicted phosphoesterase
MVTSSTSNAPKSKKVKVLTRRPRPHPLERTAVVLRTEKIEIAEQAKATPLASETIPVVTVEANVDPKEEMKSKSSTVEEHPNL